MKESTVKHIVEELTPLFIELFDGNVAIAIAGSIGKGIMDQYSDVDFRLYYENYNSDKTKVNQIEEQIKSIRERYKSQGIKIDAAWPKTISSVSEEIENWKTGKGAPWNLVWTIWGYHPITDIVNQEAVYDPNNVIAHWQKDLQSYPKELKEQLINKHMNAALYWRNDYHYESKVQRGDIVFTTGLTSKVVHHLIQVLFALNEVYYVGDGKNLEYVKQFKLLPHNFIKSIEEVLVVEDLKNSLVKQRLKLVEMIDQVDELLNSQNITYKLAFPPS